MPRGHGAAVRLLYCGDLDAGTRRLRDVGHEVIVLDPGVSPEVLVAVAVQEDVGLVAVTDAELGAAAVVALTALDPGAEDVVVFCITSDEGPS